MDEATSYLNEAMYETDIQMLGTDNDFAADFLEDLRTRPPSTRLSDDNDIMTSLSGQMNVNTDSRSNRSMFSVQAFPSISANCCSISINH